MKQEPVIEISLALAPGTTLDDLIQFSKLAERYAKIDQEIKMTPSPVQRLVFNPVPGKTDKPTLKRKFPSAPNDGVTIHHHSG